MPTVTVGGVGWSVVGFLLALLHRRHFGRRNTIHTVALAATQPPYDHRYRRRQIITTPGDPPLKYFRRRSIAVSTAPYLPLRLYRRHRTSVPVVALAALQLPYDHC